MPAEQRNQSVATRCVDVTHLVADGLEHRSRDVSRLLIAARDTNRVDAERKKKDTREREKVRTGQRRRHRDIERANHGHARQMHSCLRFAFSSSLYRVCRTPSRASSQPPRGGRRRRRRHRWFRHRSHHPATARARRGACRSGARHPSSRGWSHHRSTR